MRRLLAVVSLAIASFSLSGVPALADGVSSGDGSSGSTVTAEDGTSYECLEYNDDAGCRTNQTEFNPETGTTSDLWISPSGRKYWIPRDPKQYHWTPPPEDEPDPGPLYPHSCPDGS